MKQLCDFSEIKFKMYPEVFFFYVKNKIQVF